jgi:hypothetical protein
MQKLLEGNGVGKHFGGASSATPTGWWTRSWLPCPHTSVSRLTFACSSIIRTIIRRIRGDIMGAIAVSREEEERIKRLCKDLRIPTKSGVIRAALKILEKKTGEERLRREIQDSVRAVRPADREENRALFPSGVARRR